MAERALERVGRQFGDLPGHFDAGGSGPDHGEGQQLGTSLRITRPFGLFEGAQDPPADLERVVDRLHARGELGEMIVAEIRLACARGDNQAVIRGFVGVAEQIRHHELARQVDVGDVAEQHLDVALPAQHDPGGRGDVAFGHDARRHLVEQRLEEVVRGAGDQFDVDVGVLEFLGSVEPAEARPDDDDLVATLRSSCVTWLGAHVSAAPDEGFWTRDCN